MKIDGMKGFGGMFVVGSMFAAPIVNRRFCLLSMYRLMCSFLFGFEECD